MKNFLNLSGVSVLAIVAATNANAAGYTCEELIEYTSCNDGYYLNAGECIEGATCGAGHYIDICPAGYSLVKDLCCNDDTCSRRFYTSAGCADRNDVYYAQICADASEDDYWDMYDLHPINESVECIPCSAGTYQPNAGQYSCITTPAGNFSVAGATQYTACTPGTYSVRGAATCSTCPTHEYTNANGETVTVPATSLAGAAGMLACYVDPDTYFTDLTGTYHFKSNCSFSLGDPTSAEECRQIYGGTWTDDHNENGKYGCEVTQEFVASIITTESDCKNVYYDDYEPEWYDQECHCDGNAIWILQNGKISCLRTDW